MSDAESIKHAKYRKVASPIQAVIWTAKNNIKPSFWFHGTSKETAFRIEKWFSQFYV
jgi:hypothetical protein